MKLKFSLKESEKVENSEGCPMTCVVSWVEHAFLMVVMTMAMAVMMMRMMHESEGGCDDRRRMEEDSPDIHDDCDDCDEQWK